MNQHKLQSIRGMYDLLPEAMPAWQRLERAARELFAAYGYGELRTPIVEQAELFARSVGEGTDVVEKEMYAFEDRNGDLLALRPEGTAGVVRALIEHGALHVPGQRYWYQGPMFRHERPQQGRNRQFWQIGAEVFGLEGPDIDAELLLINQRLWRDLGIHGQLRLEINCLGSPDERRAYRDALVEWLQPRRGRLDADSQRRLETNPLRILDSKVPETRALLEDAPLLEEFLGDASRTHFSGLRELLDAAGVRHTVNPRLVRGLDYYCLSVFEWITDRLGAQGTVCAGGRYDGLVEQLGGRPTPGIGFAMGQERLVALMEAQETVSETPPHAYLVLAGDAARKPGLLLAEGLREALPWLRLVVNMGGGSFKAQFKRADRSGARLALVLGESELQTGAVAVKPLRDDSDQRSVKREALADWLAREFSADA